MSVPPQCLFREPDQRGAVVPERHHDLVAAGQLRGIRPGEAPPDDRCVDVPDRRRNPAESQSGKNAPGLIERVDPKERKKRGQKTGSKKRGQAQIRKLCRLAVRGGQIGVVNQP